MNDDIMIESFTITNKWEHTLVEMQLSQFEWKNFGYKFSIKYWHWVLRNLIDVCQSHNPIKISKVMAISDGQSSSCLNRTYKYSLWFNILFDIRWMFGFCCYISNSYMINDIVLPIKFSKYTWCNSTIWFTTHQFFFSQQYVYWWFDYILPHQYISMLKDLLRHLQLWIDH